MILRDRVTRVSLVRVFFPARRGSRARTPRSFPRRTSYHVFRRLVSRARRLSRRVPRVPRDRTGRRGVRGPFAVPRRSRRRARRGSRGGRLARRRERRDGRRRVARVRRDSREIVVEEPTRGEFGVAVAPERSPRRRRLCFAELGWATRAWTRAVAGLVRDAEEGASPREAGRAGGGVRRGDGRAAGASARTVQEVELRAHVRARRGAREPRDARGCDPPSVRLNASTTRPARARTVACAREGDVEMK